MSSATTHRYMTTLLALGYLEQGASRKYSLALALTRLGLSTVSAGSLREHARPYLHELRRQSGYTTAIAALDGLEAVYVEWLPAARRRDSAPVSAPGERLPVHCTAVGKALLASLPRYAQDALLAELRLKRCTPNTITSKIELRAELNAMAEQGSAVDDQELMLGQNAIAAPVRDQTEVVAAICVDAPAARITVEGMIDHLTPHLLVTADRISARLGYRRRDENLSPDGCTHP